MNHSEDTSVKVEWAWNKYQELFDKATVLIKKDTSMKLYNERQPLYLETDVSSASLVAGLHQALDGMNCQCYLVSDNMAL